MNYNGSNKVIIEFCFSKQNSTIKNSFLVQDSPITIGRDPSCKVVLQSKIYSKIQCSLHFDDRAKVWMIEDGFKGIKSTNGTWYLNLIFRMLLESKTEINENNTYKIANNSFKISMN